MAKRTRLGVLVWMLLLGGDASASDGVLRCIQADGSVHFVDSALACTGEAQPHDPSRRIQRLPAAPAPARAPGSARSLWPSNAELAGSWEVVREAPVEVSRDPDLVEWGVLRQDARHFTRTAEQRIQVCSIEIWTFRDVARADAAQRGFAQPGWRIERAGERVVMTRGLTLEPDVPPRPGIFPACHALADPIVARAARAPDPPSEAEGPDAPGAR